VEKPIEVLENPIVLDKPIKYQAPNHLVTPEPDYPTCACGCGKKVPPGGFKYFDDYLYDKDCWFRLAINEKWLKEVS